MEVQLEPKGPWLDFADDTSDMTVKIGAQKFDCHKCLMLRRCRFFRSLYGSVQKPRHMYIDMDGFPGGLEIFRTITNFCYGVKINLVADANFFYLSHAATFLGMSKSDMSDPDNLQEFCDKLWQEHMLNSWRSVFQTMTLLQEASKHLPKCQIDVYMQKCMEALCSLIKDMQGRDLDDFMQKLLLLPECQLGVIVSGLKTEWPQCQRTKIITSFVLAATATPLQARALNLVAESLLEGILQCTNASEREKEVGGDQPTSSEEQVYLSIPKYAPKRVYMLILIDSLSLKDEPVKKLRRNIFKKLSPTHFLLLNPQLVLKLITNFVEDEYKLLRFDHTGSDLLIQYLEQSRMLRHPIPFSLFLEFAKALSVALRNSHDRLYDEIKLYYKEVSLSKVEKQKLEHFVNCAKLSGDRLKEVIASDFSCALGDVVLALGDAVLALRKENVELKEKLEKKRPRDYSDSSLLEDETPSKIPRTLEDDEVENDLSNNSNSSQLSGSDDESDLQIVYTDEDEEEEEEDEKCLDMVSPSDFSKAFYISILTTDYMCLSFSVNVLDTVALLRMKVLEEMEMNSLSMPTDWYLMYKGKKVVENDTLHANAIEMYGEMQMQGCSAKHVEINREHLEGADSLHLLEHSEPLYPLLDYEVDQPDLAVDQMDTGMQHLGLQEKETSTPGSTNQSEDRETCKGSPEYHTINEGTDRSSGSRSVSDRESEPVAGHKSMPVKSVKMELAAKQSMLVKNVKMEHAAHYMPKPIKGEAYPVGDDEEESDKSLEYHYDYDERKWHCTYLGCTKVVKQKSELELHRLRIHRLFDLVPNAWRGRRWKDSCGPQQHGKDYTKDSLERSRDPERRYEHNLNRCMKNWENSAARLVDSLVRFDLVREEEKKGWITKWIEKKKEAYEASKDEKIEMYKSHMKDTFHLEDVDEADWWYPSRVDLNKKFMAREESQDVGRIGNSVRSPSIVYKEGTKEVEDRDADDDEFEDEDEEIGTEEEEDSRLDLNKEFMAQEESQNVGRIRNSDRSPNIVHKEGTKEVEVELEDEDEEIGEEEEED